MTSSKMRSASSAPSPSGVMVWPASANNSEAGRAVVLGSEGLLMRRLARATAAAAISDSSPQTLAAAAPTACGTAASEPIADDVVTDHAPASPVICRRTRTLVRVPARDNQLPGVLVLAEIGLPDVLIDEERLASILKHDLADFEYIAVVGERKRGGSILLDEQDRHTF